MLPSVASVEKARRPALQDHLLAKNAMWEDLAPNTVFVSIVQLDVSKTVKEKTNAKSVGLAPTSLRLQKLRTQTACSVVAILRRTPRP